MGFNFESEDQYNVRVGDIVISDGKKHKVTKVTKTAITASRYYWFDKLYDRFFGGTNESQDS